MSAYCFFDVLAIADAGKMEAYRAGVFATVAAHRGRYLVIGGRPETVEGHWKPEFPVILEFPSMEAARRWYDSPEYAPLKALRLAATRGHSVFLEGVPAAH